MTLLKQALDAIGGLSKPAKMPCYSWSLPATACITGSRLRREAPDSPCAICYARKGHYARPNVKAALARRLNVLNRALSRFQYEYEFISAFAYVLNYNEVMASLGYLHDGLDHNYFRWFDSGDLQSDEHFEVICDIATRTPHIKHWLPTREDKIVDWDGIPGNLVVRYSLPEIDTGEVGGAPTGAVHTVPGKPPPGYTECKAQDRGHKCGDCRLCWDPNVHVSYRRH